MNDFLKLDIPDLVLITPKRHVDERGFFVELFNESSFPPELGIVAHLCQLNFSVSKKNVLRGLHYQLSKPQGKLIHVIKGRVFDVVVDMRRKSETFGSWVGVELSADNGQLLWVPAGFAHGFLSLEDDTRVSYGVTEFYDPADEHCLCWNDVELGIQWPFSELPILSTKDQRGVLFRNAKVFE